MKASTTLPPEKSLKCTAEPIARRVEDTAGHEAILQDFAASVHEGREPAVPASSGRLATDLVLQIYESNVR